MIIYLVLLTYKAFYKEVLYSQNMILGSLIEQYKLVQRLYNMRDFFLQVWYYWTLEQSLDCAQLKQTGPWILIMSQLYSVFEAILVIVICWSKAFLSYLIYMI